MTDAEAYDFAVTIWGAAAVTWRLDAGRVVVGRWVPVGEYKDTHEQRVRLRSQDREGKELRGCEVMGEGASWEEAFAAAERGVKERAAAAASSGVERLVDALRRSTP